MNKKNLMVWVSLFAAISVGSAWAAEGVQGRAEVDTASVPGLLGVTVYEDAAAALYNALSDVKEDHVGKDDTLVDIRYGKNLMCTQIAQGSRKDYFCAASFGTNGQAGDFDSKR
jgi:hypothetical protein